MAKKKPTPKTPAAVQTKSVTPRSFTGVIKSRSREVQLLARALRDVIMDELPTAIESFYGGQKPMAIYRTIADVCWIQPLTARCNVYFTRGADLTDRHGLLEGSSDRVRYVKVKRIDQVEELPLREWIRESVALNETAVSDGLTIDEVLARVREICRPLPMTKETLTWGKPHFRVGEKIFCGCGESQGQPSIGLKMDVAESQQMMQVPGIITAPYSRPGDGWVSVNPNDFDDWCEIERMISGSFRLIAPKRLVATLDSR